MGKYADAYAKLTAKYDLPLDIQSEYYGANSIASVEDFSMDTSPEVKARNVYISTLSSALASYINKRVKIGAENSYDLSDFDLHDFITEFDDVMNAIRSDEAAKEKTEYTHRKFEGLPLDKVANQAWARVAPAFNKTLPTMWKERIRAGSMKIEDMLKTTNSFYSRLAPIEMDGIDKTKLHGELTNIVAAYEAMKQVRETRGGFFGFFWRLFNREENTKEVNYLNRLQNQMEILRYKEYDVDSVTNALNGKTILTRAVPNVTNAKEVRSDVAKTVNAELEKEKVDDVTLDCDNLSLSDEKRMGLNGEQLDQLKEDVEGKSVETKSVQVETKKNPTKEKAMD